MQKTNIPTSFRKFSKFSEIFGSLRKSSENIRKCRKVLKTTFQQFLKFLKSSEIIGSLRTSSEIFGKFRKISDIERIQRRAMRISFPSLSYKEALVEAGLISLSVRRQSLTDKLFTKVTTDRENKLHHLLPEQRTCHYNLRKQRRFKPVFKTNCKSSFIIHNSQKLFN